MYISVCVCEFFFLLFCWLWSFHTTLEREHRLNGAWEKDVEKNIWTNLGEGMQEKAGKM